ncbi:MAG: PKD domain-containing protein [Chloroflexota bacterium]
MLRTLITAVATAVLAASSLLSASVPSAVGKPVLIAVPTNVTPGQSTAVTLTLPGNVAAVDGRVLIDEDTGDLVGVAPVGPGEVLTPVPVPYGYAFGAYGLRSKSGKTVLRLVIFPRVSGSLRMRILVDAAADSNGRRVALADTNMVATLDVSGEGASSAAPDGRARPAPARTASPVRDLFGKGVISPEDLDIAQAAWYRTRGASASCALAGANLGADANADGCIDIVDIQALLASQGREASTRPVARGIDAGFKASIGDGFVPTDAALEAPHTFIVTSAADSGDVTLGDGICANAQGACTLRAAIEEANQNPGQQTITFNLPGQAPVLIQLGSELPLVGTSQTSMVIDGYSQPGSHVNTSTFGTNAVPGVELRGTGQSSMEYVLYVPRPNNTIRGLIVNSAFRGIWMVGATSTNNHIVGNFVGFRADNSLPPRLEKSSGVQVAGGANHNYIGTPALADRNVVGNYAKALYQYGPGTDYNVWQNNLVCIRPNGTTIAVGALCQIGIDTDFGPKHSLIGGSGANERNIIGSTGTNGIELSHGWNYNTGQPDPAWEIRDNHVIGNWVGFRQDGHYDPEFRSARYLPSYDNGEGINLVDGVSDNIIESNYVSAFYNGLAIMMSNSTGNVIRGNTVGESPYGEAAPMSRWGIFLQFSAKFNTVERNIFRNAGLGGIGLIDFNDRNITISRNVITDTSGPAIYLAPDPNNPSTGANGLPPLPIIISASTTQASGSGVNGSTVEVFKASRSISSSGLPVAFLGSAVVNGGAWTVPFSETLAPGTRIAATQTRSNGETSSLTSNSFAGGPPVLPAADFNWSQKVGTLTIDFADNSSGSPYAWSWTFGDGGTSSLQNPSWTYGAGTYDATVTVTSDSGSQSITKTVTVNPLAPGTVLAADSFERTIGDHWGMADVGGPYYLEPTPVAYSVGGGMAAMLLSIKGNAGSALLGDVQTRDLDMNVRVRARKLPVGDNLYIYAETRRNGGNAYRPKIMITPAGAVQAHVGVMVNGSESSVANAMTIPGLTYAPNTWLRMRAEVSGASPTTIRMKVWADGAAEPASWQYAVTNSNAAVRTAGTVGLRFYTSATNVPFTVNFDDYLVRSTGGAPITRPTASFASSQVPATLTVNFSDTSTNSPAGWNWNFGDGTSSTLQNPSHTYAATGAYTVTLTASNAGGSSTATMAVTVAPATPVANFSFAQQPGTLTVNFTDTSTGVPTSWGWNFGDGTSSTLQNPSHTYAASGSHSVSLTAANSGGPGTVTKTVTVSLPAPVADFTFAQQSGGTTVNFTDASTGSPTSWNWDFGDGASSTQQNPSHVYLLSGNYNVTLNASNAGGSTSVNKSVSVVIPPPPPFADFTSAQQAGTLTANFHDASIGSPASWNWDFGDGGSSTERNPTHTYVAPGDYTVTLTASNLGGSDSETKSVTVLPIPPVADFSFAQQANTLAVMFTDVSSGSPTSWIWDFGDGASSSVQHPSHIYAGGGNYTVKLTATNGGGSGSQMKTVMVVALPVANFSQVQQPGTLTVNFSDSSTGSPTGWSWDFGDGGSSSQQNPAHTYASAGSYSVTLTATNAGGTDSETKLVSVSPPTFTTYVSDSFDRTVTGGWASANIGGAYGLYGASSNFGVGSGVGTIVAPSSGANLAALLNAVSVTSVDIRFRVRVNKLPSAGNLFIYGEARRNANNAYRPKLVILPNGTIQVGAGVVVNSTESAMGALATVPGLTYTANAWLWLRAEISGTNPTTIRVKAWLDGSAEPVSWQYSATNSNAAVQIAGGVGLRLYVSGGLSNAPVTFNFDDFLVKSP